MSGERIAAAPLPCRTMPRGGLEATEDLIGYLGRYGARTDDVLDRVRAETAEMPMAQMQVSADQGALIELLVRLIGAKDALEVGTFTGYSAICIARGLADGGQADLPRARRGAGRDRAGATSTTPASATAWRSASGPAGESLEAMAAAPRVRLRVHRRRQDRLSGVLRARAARGCAPAG